MTCPIKRAADRVALETKFIRSCTAVVDPSTVSQATAEILESSIESLEEVAKELAAISERMNAAGESAKFEPIFDSHWLEWRIQLSEKIMDSSDAYNRAKHLTGLYANLTAENDGLIKERTDRAAYVARLEKDLLTGDNYRCERCRKVFHYLDMHYVGDDRYCDSCLPQAKAEDAAAEREERSIDADMRKLHSDNMRGK